MEPYETYKDSGVEWIGEIPVGRKVKKLKYVAIGRYFTCKKWRNCWENVQFKGYERDASFSGYLIKTNIEIIISDFLYAFTQTSYYDRWKEGVFGQATVQNICADKYAMLAIPLPALTVVVQV